MNQPIKSSAKITHFHPIMPAVGGLVPEVKLSSGSIHRALTKQTMVEGNQASPSSRGETVNCCGGKCTALHCVAPTVCPAPTPAPSSHTPPLPTAL